MAEIVERLPTVAEYIELRRAVEWKIPVIDAVEEALRRTTCSAVAEVGGQAVGMGRVVGDGSLYSVVVDLVVEPSHQRQGIGSSILAVLERQVGSSSATGVVQLVADTDVASFYEPLGYKSGSSRWLSKRVS